MKAKVIAQTTQYTKTDVAYIKITIIDIPDISTTVIYTVSCKKYEQFIENSQAIHSTSAVERIKQACELHDNALATFTQTYGE